ncbi:hypothetical protein XU18_1893 [Perkinsela sp. CCAP 1560/4]|nr:hypothetical protein XU18_1893 [Perkinsela sp. CCAP 1560/4]|eukprot:KNH07361.1 hypothetical protein XU18_1893 [Perkinsela sp. CCAP 1560/4]
MLSCTRCLAMSQAYPLGERPHWSSFWKRDKSYPSVRPGHPVEAVNRRLRKSTREWQRYHGFGNSAMSQGLAKEIPDWEYADGTPGTASMSNYHFLYYKNKLLFQIIKSAALVEQRLAEGTMPKIPGTRSSRDWDPQIPLFLEDSDDCGQHAPPNAIALDLSEISDLKMKRMPLILDNRKRHMTRESLVPRVPTLTRAMKEDWKPSPSLR